MINLNLSIRQKDNEEASSFSIKITENNDIYGLWHCVIYNNCSPLNKISIHKDSFEELIKETDDYINGLGIVINVYEIDVTKEIFDWINKLKHLTQMKSNHLN